VSGTKGFYVRAINIMLSYTFIIFFQKFNACFETCTQTTKSVKCVKNAATRVKIGWIQYQACLNSLYLLENSSKIEHYLNLSQLKKICIT